MESKRIIHTGLYTKLSYDILKVVWRYLGDNWGSRQMARNAEYGVLQREYNGEITMHINCGSWEYRKTVFYTYKDDNIIRGWIANVMKAVLIRSSKNNPDFEWDRANQATAKYFNDIGVAVTTHMIYCMYDVLKLRKNAQITFKDVYADLVGEERDPFMAEQEKIKHEETEQLRNEYAKKMRALDDESWTKQEEARNAVRAEYNEKKARLAEERDQKIAELEATFSMLSMAS